MFEYRKPVNFSMLSFTRSFNLLILMSLNLRSELIVLCPFIHEEIDDAAYNIAILMELFTLVHMWQKYGKHFRS